jgi:MFS family permease
MTILGSKTGRERASRAAGPYRRPATGAVREQPPAPPPAFWLVAGVLFLSLAAASAPAPLYGVYQAQFRFSAATLTAVFAVYALVVLITLLVFGSLSDYLGRRPVIIATLAVNIGACVLFLTAQGVGLLFAARVLQGIAVGAATGALGAALIDLQPEGSGLAPVVNTGATILGLAVGALGASGLVQYGPAPTRLVWWLLLGAFFVAIAGILVMRESAARRPGVLTSLRPRVKVPPRARGTFAVAVPCLQAAWALAGLYLSLGPSLAAQVLGSPNRLWGGLTVFLLAGIGAAATVLCRGLAPPTAMLAGCLVLLTGAAVTFASIAAMSAAAFLSGTAVAGVGFGMAFLGAFRTLSALADPGERAALIAGIFTVNYLAFGIPALIAGVAVTRYGLHRTALVYLGVIAALATAAAISMMARKQSAGHQAGGSTRLSSLRELMPSFSNTLCRCHSTVRGLMNSRAPISGFDSRSQASRAICVSWGVRSLDVSTVRLRTVSPVATSSRRARSSNASMPIAPNISWAVRSRARASRRRPSRRSHSPYSRCARASSGRNRVRPSRSIASR